MQFCCVATLNWSIKSVDDKLKIMDFDISVILTLAQISDFQLNSETGFRFFEHKSKFRI